MQRDDLASAWERGTLSCRRLDGHAARLPLAGRSSAITGPHSVIASARLPYSTPSNALWRPCQGRELAPTGQMKAHLDL